MYSKWIKERLCIGDATNINGFAINGRVSLVYQERILYCSMWSRKSGSRKRGTFGE